MILLPTLLLSAIYALSLTSQLQASILNGNDDSETPVTAAAERRQFPYIVSIGNHEILHQCRGSILTQLWIVTSGACAVSINSYLPGLKVIAGKLNLFESHSDMQKIDIEYVIWPREIEVSDAGLVNNIGLIKLAYPLKFTEAVQPIQLPKQGQNFQGPAVTVGWHIYTSPFAYPYNIHGLKYIYNKIITNEECQDIYSKLPKSPSIPDSMICTAPLIGFNTSCHGDLGAPLVQNNVLAGIFSRGVDCTPYLQGAPSIFTRVSQHLDFIRYYIPEV